jgi:hypothetical protein
MTVPVADFAMALEAIDRAAQEIASIRGAGDKLLETMAWPTSPSATQTQVHGHKGRGWVGGRVPGGGAGMRSGTAADLPTAGLRTVQNDRSALKILTCSRCVQFLAARPRLGSAEGTSSLLLP